jgi:hypothetical protein
MAEKQKPQPRIVTVAAKAMNNPKTVTQKDIKRMAARILDDQRNDPYPHGRTPKPRGGSRGSRRR